MYCSRRHAGGGKKHEWWVRELRRARRMKYPAVSVSEGLSGSSGEIVTRMARLARRCPRDTIREYKGAWISAYAWMTSGRMRTSQASRLRGRDSQHIVGRSIDELSSWTAKERRSVAELWLLLSSEEQSPTPATPASPIPRPPFQQNPGQRSVGRDVGSVRTLHADVTRGHSHP